MVFPSASAQLAFAAGLGFEALSICAEPSAAINPTVRHPAAKNAYCFLIDFPPTLCPSIEPDLPARRNMEFSFNPNRRVRRRLVSPSLYFVPCETVKKGLKVGSSSFAIAKALSTSAAGVGTLLYRGDSCQNQDVTC